MATTDELLWLAFRYLADELPTAEAAAFELQLANEQPARDALAEIVALSEAVALAEHQLEPGHHVPVGEPLVVASRSFDGWSRAAGYVAWAAAACLALVAVLLMARQDADRPGAAPLADVADDAPSDTPIERGDAGQRHAETEQLAVAWIRLKSGTIEPQPADEATIASDAWKAGVWNQLEMDDASHQSFPAEGGVEVQANRPAPPGWLLAAVATDLSPGDAADGRDESENGASN